VSTTGAEAVCNRNWVPAGDCHDGLWGQMAVWPPNFVRVAWEPAAPVHCPPWWPRAPMTFMGRADSAAGQLAVFGNASPGSRLVWHWPRHEPDEGLVHSSCQRPEVTGEAGSGWALPCVRFGILSIPPVEAGGIELDQGGPGCPIRPGSL
jgi:hypothetical protein